MIRSFDAWVFARLSSGHPCDELIETLLPRLRPVAKYMAGLEPLGRPIALGGFLVAQHDRDEIDKAVAAADPLGPAPALSAGQWPASALDLEQVALGVQWAWPLWVPRGRVSGVAGFEGTGKTRFALDLARRAYHGLPWPDGQPMTLPAGSRSLWICGDGHQEEIAETAGKMNIPLDAILFNAFPENPCGGADLDDPDALETLDAFLEISAAPLVFVDTLTNSTSRDLCRQTDVKLLLCPLQEIAQRRQVAIALLLHLSREGQALGRRTKGLTRTLIHLACPDARQPTRLRLWVEKSFDVKPPALNVTMGDAGNEYDDDPPGEPDDETSLPRKRGKAPVKLDACKQWVTEKLNPHPVRVKDIRAAAVDAGYGAATLYSACKVLGVEEDLVDGRKWWRLPDPSLVSIV
jgi:hypothetical protein